MIAALHRWLCERFWRKLLDSEVESPYGTLPPTWRPVPGTVIETLGVYEQKR